MTKTLLLCGCGLTMAWASFGQTADPEPPKTSPNAPAELDPADLLKKIEALDGSAKDSSLPADPNRKGDDPSKANSGPTVISALDTDFQQESHQAVFLNQVVVNNASFHLVCDKLTAFLTHDKPGTKGAPKPAATPAPIAVKGKAGALPANNDAVERLVGEGSVQIVQDKLDDSGNITRSVGHGRRMVYEKSTGDITLYGMPDMQQGDNVCVATDESTIMVINRDGHMKAYGPHETVIKEKQEEKPPGSH